MNSSLPPPFWELQAYPFQELSCDLLLVQVEVASAHVYGRPRQAQRGIDLRALLRGGGLWLVQCKAYKSFNATQLNAAAEEFRQHLLHWQQLNARRFTIFVGCGVEDTKVWDAVDTQRKQFDREGIAFELWDSRILKERLQPHRGIVERHCRAPWWVDQICGTASSTGVVAQAGVSGESLNHSLVAAISTEIGELRSRELEEIRELIRTGREQTAEERLHALRASPSWAHLPAELRARTLRTGVGLVLNQRGDLAEARALLAEAKQLEPHRRMSVAEALLISREAGAAAALDQFSHPADPDEWNFRLALLLSAGRTEEALRLISAPPFTPNAETFRLQALAHLWQRDVSAASAAAQRALVLQPRWQLVRETAAVVDYFQSISPASEIWVHLDWPIPPEWHLVRRDAKSAAALQQAEKQFAALAGEPEKTADAQRRYQAWQLACLGCDTSRRGEAEAQARALLTEHPGHIAAIVWTLERGWDIPMHASRAELEKQCRLQPRIDLIQTLFALLAHNRDWAAAGALLDAHLAIYDVEGAASLWRFGRAQIWVASGDPTQAEALLAAESDPQQRSRLEATLAGVRAGIGGDPRELALARAARYAADPSGANLFAACDAHHAIAKPAFISKHARELVEKVGTESAVRLALDGTFENGDVALCLELLDGHRDRFARGVLPPPLRRLRVECLRRTGRIVEAEREAEALAGPEGELEDRWLLFETQRHKGNLPAAILTAYRLISDPQTSREGLLHLATHLQPDAPQVAKEAFSEILRRGVNSPQLAAAVAQVGFALGEDDRLGPLLAQAIAIANQPGAPMVTVSIDEVRQMQAAERQEHAQLAEAYARGELPIHFYAGSTGMALAGLFHGAMDLNAAAYQPWKSFSTRIRHGSHDTPRLFEPAEHPSLFLDLTAYLLAGHLDLLDLLEAEFSPLQVSPFLPLSLQHQIKLLAKEQPTRHPPRAEVLAAVESGRIHLLPLPSRAPLVTDDDFRKRMGGQWGAVFDHAAAEDGYLVDRMPLRSNDAAFEPIAVPLELEGKVRGCRDLLEALNALGALSHEQYDRANDRLDCEEGYPARATELRQSVALALEFGIAETLAYAGLLQPLLARCRISLRADEADHLRAETERRRQRMELVAWLRRLRDHLSRGLDRGTYVPRPSLEPIGEREHFAAHPEGRCLWDTLDKARPERVWTVCDDRRVGAIERIGDSRVIGTFDLLHELHRREKLSAEALYAHIHRLRAGNARYLPLQAEEVLHHLRRAQVGPNGTLIELPELAALRRYTAACTLDGEHIQRLPPTHPRAAELTEMRCIISFYGAAVSAITGLWREKGMPRAKLIAASDWVLQQLWIDFPGILRMMNGTAQPDLAGIAEANLIFQAISLHGRLRAASDEDDAPQEDYLRWVFSRLEPDAGRKKAIGKHLREYLLRPSERGDSKRDRLMKTMLMADLYIALPPSMREAIRLTKANREMLKLSQWEPLRLGDFAFDAAEFWRAAEETARNGNAILPARDPAGKHFTMRPARKGNRPAVELLADGLSKPMPVSDLRVGLVQPDTADREAALAADRQSLDVSKAKAATLFPQIAKEKRRAARLRHAAELLNSSVTNLLAVLHERLSKGLPVRYRELSPLGIAGPLRHLRLSADELSPPALEVAAAVLLREEGFSEAFFRLATLPVALPRAIIDGFKSWEAAARGKWVETTLQARETPVVRLHFGSLLLHGSAEEMETGVQVLCELMDAAAEPTFEAFESLLSWTFNELSEQVPERTAGAALLAAAWVHATRLHQVLARFIAPADLAADFSERARLGARDVFRHRRPLTLDAAHPNRLSRNSFLAHGLASALRTPLLSEEHKPRLAAALRAVCFPLPDHPAAPALDLLLLRSCLSDHLHSFLSGRDEATFARFLGEEDAGRFSSAQMSGELDLSIRQLEEDPSRDDAWVNLSAILGVLPAPAALQPRMLGLLMHTRWAALLTPEATLRQTALLFLTNQALNFPDESMLEHCRTQFFELCEKVASSTDDQHLRSERASLLVNCAHLLAASRAIETERAEELAALLGDAAERWPVAAPYFTSLLTPLLLRQSMGVRDRLWPLISKLRVMGGMSQAFDRQSST